MTKEQRTSAKDFISAARRHLASSLYHTDQINRLAKFTGTLGETSESVVNSAIARIEKLEKALFLGLRDATYFHHSKHWGGNGYICGDTCNVKIIKDALADD